MYNNDKTENRTKYYLQGYTHLYDSYSLNALLHILIQYYPRNFKKIYMLNYY